MTNRIYWIYLKSIEHRRLFNVTKVESGLAAVDACKQISPDIIILDVMLPVIDGYEVCKRIRQFSHCPILFLSSKTMKWTKFWA